MGCKNRLQSFQTHLEHGHSKTSSGRAEAVSVLKLNFIESFAVGASFATMPFGFNQLQRLLKRRSSVKSLSEILRSTGIALNVMKAGGVLNQPSGQLLLAAATVNELINISLITEIDAIVANGPWHTFVPRLNLAPHDKCLTFVIYSICMWHVRKPRFSR